MKLQRKIKHYKKGCPAQDLGSMPKVKVTIRSHSSNHVSAIILTNEGNLMGLHRKTLYGKKVFYAQGLCFHAQGRSHSQGLEFKSCLCLLHVLQKLLKHKT